MYDTARKLANAQLSSENIELGVFNKHPGNRNMMIISVSVIQPGKDSTKEKPTFETILASLTFDINTLEIKWTSNSAFISEAKIATTEAAVKSLLELEFQRVF